MNLIAKNEELISTLEGDLTLLSSRLYQVDIFKRNENLIIEIYLELLYSKINKKIRLVFDDVQEYSFYYNSKHIFYNVESYKFLMTDGLAYISLDPFDEDDVINANDQDFILSKSVEGYFI